MTATNLNTLVEIALTTYPALAYKDGGSRADAAADLIDRHQVAYLGVQYGLDWWEINGHKVSIKNGTCDCFDYAAPMGGKARLCKHMLAAMMTRKLELGQQTRLAEIFRNAPGDRVTLKLDVFGKGRNLDYWLNGYHYLGQPWEIFRYEDRRQITVAMFEQAIADAGFFIADCPSKQPGFAHHYPLARIGTAAMPEQPWHLYDLTAENRRRFDQLATDERVLERVLAA